MKNATNRRSNAGPDRCRIGLLGGSFNPAHDGHLHVSRQALTLLGLDEIWWLVSPQNPLKPAAGMASLDDRLDKARLVARDQLEIQVSAVEASLGTRYTVDTVEALRGRHPDNDFVLLVGADILDELHRWRRWEGLFHLVPIAVFARKPYSVSALSGPAAQRFAQFRIPEEEAPSLADRPPPAWVFLHIMEHPASATAVRAARGNG